MTEHHTPLKPLKQFRQGLVVGKFCPLHKGHELVIQQAIAHCDEVIVISYTKPELPGCPSQERATWIASIFPTVKALVLDDVILKELCAQHQLPIRTIPHNDAAEEDHREFVGWLCWEIFHTTIDAVFTSEDYGDGFANALSAYFKARRADSPVVKHICVDKARSRIPASGTSIRENPHVHQQFLSPDVYASFVKRVCILGGESSGKTTLSIALATHFKTTWVPEYGRELWIEKNGKLQFDDMLHIAREQVARENALAKQAQQWLFCDTSPLTTLFYSLAMFDQADTAFQELSNRRYDMVFICASDIPFTQDGTRRDALFRQRQHAWYVKELNDRAMPFVDVSGSLASRIETVTTALQTLL